MPRRSGETTMTDPFDLSGFGGGTPSSPYDPPPAEDAVPLQIGRPPLGWLLGALLAAVVGALGVLVVHEGLVTLVPWVIAGPGAILLLGVFSMRDTTRRAMPVYAAGGWVGPARAAVVVVVLLAVAITAVNIALWAGRL